MHVWPLQTCFTEPKAHAFSRIDRSIASPFRVHLTESGKRVSNMKQTRLKRMFVMFIPARPDGSSC